MASNGKTGSGRKRKKAGRVCNGFLCATSVASIVLGAAASTVPTGTAFAQQAQGEVRSFNIPGQPLAGAVAAFGRQSGLQVSLAASSAAGVRTNPVAGTMDPYSALTQMLSGTGLYWWLSESGAVIIASSRSSAAPATGAEGDVLDVVVVTDEEGSGYQGTPDWVYEVPDSVSVISGEAIENLAVRDTNELFNSASGVYAGSTVGSFPTVSPNIRGLQDEGRVIVSIDGARLNSQDGGRYGGADIGGMSMAFVDTAFVRAVDITKKTNASANNAGSLGGTVDFRLVRADDVIAPGERWGVSATGAAGTNGYDYSSAFVGAVRLGDAISVTLGASSKELSEYEPGEFGDAEGRFDLTYRRNWSALAKIEAEFETVTASLAWLHQHNDFAYAVGEGADGSSFDAGSDTIIADVDWIPDTPMIDLSAKFWAQLSQIDETRDARYAGTTLVAAETDIGKAFTSFGVILENTSELSTGLGDLSLNYGIEAFRDVADKSASSSAIDDNPLFANSYGSWTPPGRRDIASGFMNGTLEPADWVTLSGGLRYDWSRLKGNPTYFYQLGTTTTTAGAVISEVDYFINYLGFDPFIAGLIGSPALGEVFNNAWYIAGTSVTYAPNDYLSETEEIDRTDAAWLPSATIEFAPVDWFKPYASYSQSFRPPTLSEAFAAGSVSPGDIIGTNLAPNTDLRPEKARTYEIGANLVADQIFTDSDRLRLKVSGFYREVDDYIVVGDLVTHVPSRMDFYSFVNLDGTAYMKGVELEGNYDAGYFWFGGSFSLLEIDWPQKTQTFSNGTLSTTGESIFWNSTVPPKQKLVLDAGVRLFDQRLSLGARMNHATPSSEPQLDTEGNVVENGDPYTTLDLYGSFKVTDNAVLRMSVNNVTDINYLPINSAYVAPGRTMQASLKIRF